MDPHTETVQSEASGRRALGGATAARWSAAAVLLACAGVLAMAVWLKPDARGYGTHEVFGTGPCGMMVVTGYPCPTCGMTTAFCHAVRGQWLRAFLVQPAGFVLALATMAFAGTSVYVLVAGRWPTWVVRILSSYWLFVGLLALLLGAWGFKIVLGLLTGTVPTH